MNVDTDEPSWRYMPRTHHSAEDMDAEKALNTALAKAQGEFPPIPKERTVKIKTKDGTYSYSYATLDVILGTVRPVLAKHGLSLIQRLDDEGGRPAIRTEIRHAEGGMIGATFPIGDRPQNPQQLGSLLTYLRRYTIQAMLGIAPEEDDDGQVAGKKVSVGEPQADKPLDDSVSQAAVGGEPASPTEDKPKYASEDQRGLIFHTARANGFDADDFDGLREILKNRTGQESTAKIPADQVDNILADMRTEEELIT